MRRPGLVSLLTGLALMAAAVLPSAALAAPAVPPSERAPAPQQEGRRIDRSDWVDHLPLAIGMALVVIAVDAVFIMKIVRDRRAERERREAALRPPLPVNGYGPHGPGRF